MGQKNRKLVSVRSTTWDRANELRDALAEKSGRKITLSDVFERSLDSLADAHSRGAWLSPKEAAPLLEQRNRDRTVSILAQFIARLMPERQLRGVVFDPATQSLIVHLEGEAPVQLFMGGTETARLPDEPVN